MPSRNLLGAWNHDLDGTVSDRAPGLLGPLLDDLGRGFLAGTLYIALKIDREGLRPGAVRSLADESEGVGDVAAAPLELQSALRASEEPVQPHSLRIHLSHMYTGELMWAYPVVVAVPPENRW